MPMVNGRSMAGLPSSRTIRTGAISSCSTNTSTARTVRASGPATRRAGPVWWPRCWTCSGVSTQRRCWRVRRVTSWPRSSGNRWPDRRRARSEGARMSDPRYPALYQINTRVWLTELSQALGRRASLDDIPDAELDRLALMGFDWVWLLSVWQTGPAAQAISRANPRWRREFAETLPDLEDDDIAGSGFAIQGY